MNHPSIKIWVGALALGLAIPVAAHAAPVAAPAAAPAAVARHYSTSDTTIGELLDNAATKAVIDRIIPGLSDNPQMGMAAGMTFRMIQPMAGDKITVEQLDAIDAELAKIDIK